MSERTGLIFLLLWSLPSLRKHGNFLQMILRKLRLVACGSKKALQGKHFTTTRHVLKVGFGFFRVVLGVVLFFPCYFYAKCIYVLKKSWNWIKINIKSLEESFYQFLNRKQSAFPQVNSEISKRKKQGVVYDGTQQPVFDESQGFLRSLDLTAQILLL